jgi:hypothetical protein
VVADRALVEGVHERPPVQLDGHPALAIEGDERLAHRDAADPELLGDPVLGDTFTRAELAVEDPTPDRPRRLVAAAAADERDPAITRAT